jgi:hypothetical protein
MRPHFRLIAVLAFAAALALGALTGCTMMQGQTTVHGGSDHPTTVGTSITVPWGK